MWQLIKAIKEDDVAIRKLVPQDVIGEPLQKRTKRIYKKLQTCQYNLRQEVVTHTHTVDDFLRGVAHNIRWAPVNREAANGD